MQETDQITDRQCPKTLCLINEILTLCTWRTKNYSFTCVNAVRK